MSTSTPPAGSPRRHRVLGAIRSLNPAALIAVTLALVLGGAGGAAAANGGNFLLGKANTETATASLANSKGTPLSLTAPAGKAPLAVNRNTMVTNLNAQYTGGFTGTQLEATGGENSNFTTIPIGSTPTVVANTGPLPNGAYVVIATAQMQIAAGDGAGFCTIDRGSAPDTPLSNSGGGAQAAATTTVVVSAGDSLVEECSTLADNGSETVDTGITAIRLLAAFHPSSARAAGIGTKIPVPPHRPAR
jgi:hypothetical protein